MNEFTSRAIPVCFTLQLKPEYVEEYRDMHSPVWPDMLKAIAEAGWRNYSIFLREDGCIVGYFEAADPEQAKIKMASFEVSDRWASSSEHLFAGRQQWLTPIFNLESQLSQLVSTDQNQTGE